jgi:NitT/TauT family transport system permease protein
MRENCRVHGLRLSLCRTDENTRATSTASEERIAFGWVDAVVLLAIFGLLWSVLHFGRGMLVYSEKSQMPQLSTNLSDIPLLRGTHVLRMCLVFAFSLLFTLIGPLSGFCGPADYLHQRSLIRIE